MKELQELKVNIELIPTAPAADADKFRTAPFWKEVRLHPARGSGPP